MLVYRRPMNLKDMIGSNTILDNKVNRRNPTIKTIKFCQPSNTRNSLCCNHLKTTNSFTSLVTKNEYKIYHESNCKSKSVIFFFFMCLVWNKHWRSCLSNHICSLSVSEGRTCCLSLTTTSLDFQQMLSFANPCYVFLLSFQ